MISDYSEAVTRMANRIKTIHELLASARYAEAQPLLVEQCSDLTAVLLWTERKVKGP